MAMIITGTVMDPPVCPSVELSNKNVMATCEMVIEAMKNGLPNEAHSMEVFDYILRESSKILHSMPVKL